MQSKSSSDSFQGEAVVTRSDRLYDRIKDLIVSGALPPGYLFPNENDMCQQLSVGRSTLREAYRSLDAMGLISRSKAGTTVNDLETIIERAPFHIAAELSGFGDVVEFRLMLEGECARYAALRATDEELELLIAQCNQHDSETGDFEERQRNNMDFHMLISRCSHNILLRSALNSAWPSFIGESSKQLNRLDDQLPAYFREANRQHHLVCDAICARDAAGAKNAMRNHIATVYGLVPEQS